MKIKAIFITLMVIFNLILLTGCVTAVHSEVTNFYDTKFFQKQGHTFSIQALDEQKGSLEFQKYATLIQNKLESLGWVKTDENIAEYFVFFRYGINGGRQSGTSHYYNAYTGNTNSINHYSYTRFLHFDIIDRKKSNSDKIVKVFESKVKSSGGSSTFSAVGGCLIDALFKDFPSGNGKTRHVKIKTNITKCI